MSAAMLLHLFGRLFWIPAFIGIAAGFWLPGDYSQWTATVPWLLGGILFFPSLKVRFGEVLAHLGDRGLPQRMGALTTLKLLVFPSVTWGVAQWLAPAWAPGLTLVAMMPAGLTSLAFTDLNHGNRVLALVQVIATSVVAPLTVPLLLTLIAPGQTDGIWSASAERAIYIITLLAIPFTIAQVLRRYAADFIDQHGTWWTQGSMVCSCALAFVALAVNRHAWAGWSLGQLLVPLALACLSVGIAAAGCWLVAKRLDRENAIAFTCGALYLNNGLAVAFATRFFPGHAEMVLPAALITIPMVIALAVAGGVWRNNAECRM